MKKHLSAKDHQEIATLGMEFAAAEALGTGGGLWLDAHWNTRPWLTILGAFIGFMLGMYIVVRSAQAKGASPAKKQTK